MRNSWSKLLVIGIILVATFGTIIVMQNPLSIYSRASSPKDLPSPELDPNQNKGLAKLIELNKEIENQKKAANLSVKKSLEFGYELSFDPRLWEETPYAANPQAVSSITLSLKKDFGTATFQLLTYPAQAIDLDSLARSVEKDETARKDFVAKEKVTIGTTNAYKFTLQEHYFGKDIPYNSYYFAANHRYYKVITKQDGVTNVAPEFEALLGHLSFDNQINGQEVQGVTDNAETSANKYEAVHIAELSKPSIVNILHVVCKKIATSTAANAVYLRPNYRVCSAFKGTGFIISPKGHIATNGHVVKMFPRQVITEELFYPQSRPFLEDLVKEVNFLSTGQDLNANDFNTLLSAVSSNPNALNGLVSSTLDLVQKGVVNLGDDGDRYYINPGKDAFIIHNDKITLGDIDSAIDMTPGIFQASLVDYNFPGSDVAILKIKNGKESLFPALPLGDSHLLKEGEPLVLIGFPTLVEGSQGEKSLLDYKYASITPTVTKGIVSAIKIDENGKKVIQTDASIEHGNSGGPALNEKGEVIGLVTFGIQGALGNYNFIRDVNDLKTIMAKNKIEVSNNDTYTLWQTGLENFWNDYFTRSLRAFQKVKTLYPLHSTVDEYMIQSNRGIQSNHDNGLFFGIEKDMLLAVGIITSFMALGLVAFGTLRRQGLRLPQHEI